MSDDLIDFDDLRMIKTDSNDADQDKSIQGEKKLLAAVLHKAVDDIRSNDIKIKAEVEEWFSEPYREDGGEPFSFQYICENLDLDSNTVREYIFRSILE